VSEAILGWIAVLLGLLGLVFFRSIGDAIADFCLPHVAHLRSRILRVQASSLLWRIATIGAGLFLLLGGISTVVS